MVRMSRSMVSMAMVTVKIAITVPFVPCCGCHHGTDAIFACKRPRKRNSREPGSGNKGHRRIWTDSPPPPYPNQLLKHWKLGNDVSTNYGKRSNLGLEKMFVAYRTVCWISAVSLSGDVFLCAWASPQNSVRIQDDHTNAIFVKDGSLQVRFLPAVLSRTINVTYLPAVTF